MSEYDLFIGSFNEEDNAAILFCRLDPISGRIEQKCKYTAKRPSYLMISEDESRLFCVNECNVFGGKYGGGAQVYEISADGLSLLDEISIGAKGPTHFHLSKSFMPIACYGEGSIAVAKLGICGFEGSVQKIRHIGGSVHPIRQSCPHPHFAKIAPAGDQLLICDLGTDELLLYPFNENVGIAGEPKRYKAPLGSGPRHAIFSTDGKYLYVITELSCQVLAYRYEGGELIHIQTAEMPMHSGQVYQGGAIKLNPSGNELAVTVRGSDLIAFFAVENGGFLRYEGSIKAETHPRDAEFSPDGKLFLCAGQRSDTVSVFSYSDDTGICPEKRITLLNINKFEKGIAPCCIAMLRRS